MNDMGGFEFNVYKFDAAGLDYTGFLYVAAESVAQALSLFECVHSNIPYGYGRYMYRGIEIKHPELTWMKALHPNRSAAPEIISDTLIRI